MRDCVILTVPANFNKAAIDSLKASGVIVSNLSTVLRSVDGSQVFLKWDLDRSPQVPLAIRNLVVVRGEANVAAYMKANPDKWHWGRPDISPDDFAKLTQARATAALRSARLMKVAKWVSVALSAAAAAAASYYGYEVLIR